MKNIYIVVFVSFSFILNIFPKTLLAFLVQLQTLIMKRGAVSPLYLHLACEDLRSFASFDKVPYVFTHLCTSYVVFFSLVV